MNTTPENSLRKVAILVASLDETWADRILTSLPAQQARTVRRIVDELTDIDFEEQDEIVAEFRRRLEQPAQSNSAGVELDASLLERIDHEDYTATTPQPHGPFEGLSTDDVALLAAMLDSEGPQTAAVLLSRLESERAAEVLNSFSVERQHEILERLAGLDVTDDQAVRVVEAQVAQWLTAQRQRRERMAAGKQMVERLMSHRQSEPPTEVLGTRMPRTQSAVANEYSVLSTPKTRLPQRLRYEPLPPARQSEPVEPAHPLAHLGASECAARLEGLSDHNLLNALARCESHVALLSLVGVSEKLLKRVTRGLSRHENKLLRQQLRDIGPTRLSDILVAQQKVLYAAQQSG